MGDDKLKKRPVTYITSSDGKKWSSPAVLDNVSSEHGAQLAVFKGKVWGVITSSSDNQYKWLYLSKWSKKSGWSTGFDTPGQKYRAEGRASVAVLGDRFYVLYRGTNNGVYLIYTEDGVNWRDLGRIGSKYAETHQSPAILAIGNKLILVGVGADKKVYYTITDKDGKREKSWAVVDSRYPSTIGGLALAPVYTSPEEQDPEDPMEQVALFRIFEQYYAFGYHIFALGKDWDAWYTENLVTRSYTGVAATAYKDHSTLVAYMDPAFQLSTIVIDKDHNSSEPQKLAENSAYFSQPGVAYLDGEIVISYVTQKDDEDVTKCTAYTAPAIMDEKKALTEANGEWNCKWQEEKDNNTDVKSMIRACFCL